MKSIMVALSCAALTVAGCATKASEISAQYVSPARYRDHSCDQVRSELVSISTRVREVSGQQDRRASSDAVATGVAIVLFWPAALFLMNEDHADELRLLKGRYEALEKVARDKQCPVAAELTAARAGLP